MSSNEITRLVEEVIESRALGRSPIYAKILRYLGNQTVNGSVCTEYSIAIDVFAKDAGYEVSSDSTVRVYIYNLRKKLEKYYSGLGEAEPRQIAIPLGEYRLEIQDAVADDQQEARLPTADLVDEQVGRRSAFSKRAILIGLALTAASSLMTLWVSNQQSASAKFSQQQMLFWGGVIADDTPVMIVIGDYYIFAEVADEGDVRLVREFDINSADDLKHHLLPNYAADSFAKRERFDLGLTYLPRGSAYAMAKLQELILRANKVPKVKMMSEFSADDLLGNHVIYIGYVSGLGVLESYTFSDSRFQVGTSYDVLIDVVNGNAYRSDFIEAKQSNGFTDFGLISSFPLVHNNRADKNQVVVLAGTRDAGLMEMSDLATTSNLLSRMRLEQSQGGSFEALFSVGGFDLTNVTSELIVGDNKLLLTPSDAE